jgi:hypothetical protein
MQSDMMWLVESLERRRRMLQVFSLKLNAWKNVARFVSIMVMTRRTEKCIPALTSHHFLP